MKQNPSIYEFEAIGTHWWIESLAGDMNDEIRSAIDTYIGGFTRAYSRFDENSLISQLNNEKIIDNPPTQFVEMLKFAQQMFLASDGIFNISVSGTLHRLGFGSRSRANHPDPIFWEKAEISDERITIPSDTTIDIDGFGKGWMIDEIAALLERHGVGQYIVNGGGDMYVRSDSPIEIALEHPTDPGMSIGKTYLKNEALAASSIIKRSWMHEGKNYHHIIDPRTDNSSDGDVVASFVKAPTALLADTIATILVVDPLLEAKMQQQFSLQTIILRRDQLKT